MTICPKQHYQAYTTKFDIEIDANLLDSVLSPLTEVGAAAVDEAWRIVETELVTWRTKLLLDAADVDKRVRNCLSDEDLKQTSVTLLFDQSGSMRGQKILFSAAAADIIQEFLVTLGVRCEILGFTTSQWKGGRSRRRWKRWFRPRNPGRLNDLLHVIYKSANDRRASTGGWVFRQMLRHDLTKENIDGEAIEWAVRRLSLQPTTRKLLIVLSDGAPVDDSTLLENGPNYLSDHLKSVVEDVIARGEVCIAAFGIGYRTQDFYPVSSHVEAPKEICKELLALLERMLTNRCKFT